MNERAKVISRDGVQFVELPAGLTLGDGEWSARRDGAAVVLEPLPRATGSVEALLALLATWEPLDEVVSEIEDAPPSRVDPAFPRTDDRRVPGLPVENGLQG